MLQYSGYEELWIDWTLAPVAGEHPGYPQTQVHVRYKVPPPPGLDLGALAEDVDSDRYRAAFDAYLRWAERLLGLKRDDLLMTEDGYVSHSPGVAERIAWALAGMGAVPVWQVSVHDIRPEGQPALGG